MKKSKGQDWTSGVYIRPTPRQVAQLMDSHGGAAVRERWGWLNPDTLSHLATQGRREMRGDQPKAGTISQAAA
jgi:hypothetical protein